MVDTRRDRDSDPQCPPTATMHGMADRLSHVDTPYGDRSRQSRFWRIGYLHEIIVSLKEERPIIDEEEL
jgi:hypothetical protein